MGLDGIVEWLKKNPIYTAIGVLGTVFGFIKGIPPAWTAISETFGIPECVTVSDRYYYYSGHFTNTRPDTWVEFQPAAKLNFLEINRNRNYVILLNKTPRADPRWESMLVRLPICGGTAQWTYENPQQWVDLFDVARSASATARDGQAKLEQQ
jgi:hypothetical protein